MADDPRIPEILALRAADPSLGLKEAKDIVDARRATALTEEICTRCQRRVARNAQEAMAGWCPRQWAYRDAMAEADCDKHVAALLARARQADVLERRVAELEAGLRDACDAIDNLSPSALVRDANVPDLRQWRSLLTDATKETGHG